MNSLEFEAMLNEVYDGAVKVSASNKYVNERTALRFNCSSCGVTFFGKPPYMVGQDHQRHHCHKPYGNAEGTRNGYVSTIRKTKKGKNLDLALLDKMVWEDYTFQQIAQEFQVNPLIIKDYFKAEGLL